MKRILRLSAAIVIPAVLLVTLVIGSGNTSVFAQQEGTPSPTPAATPQSGPPRSNEQVPHAADLHPPKYDNMTSLLNEIVVQYEEGALTARAAASTAPLHGGESVEVTFHIEEAHVRDVWDYLQANNVPAREPLEDEHFIEADVPVSLLAGASEQPGVIKVKPITPNRPAQGTTGGQVATAHGADAWHDDGYKGQGVKVGVLDLGFTGFSDLQGTELPSSVQVKCADGTTLSDCTGSSKHGTGITEILYDVAPDASYYIYLATTKGDWKRAVDWMVSQGVDVINASISREWDGPGDGTSPYTDSPLKAVDAAVTGGSVFVTSAGNEGQSSWYGSFTDVDDDGVLEFATDDECNGVELVADKTFIAQLRWNDPWAYSRKDFDLYLRPIRNGVPGLEVARSSDWQDGDAGDVPHEAVYYTPSADGSYCLSVEQKTLGSGSSSVLPSWVQLQSYIGPSLEHSTTSHGITNPAGTRNAGALAVGAAHWNDTATIYTHSSRGPLPDGTIKPDIVGAHFVETSSYGSSSSGTSFASPHVAGLAALVKQVYSSRSPSGIATYLKDNALGRDTVPNNTWGYGFAQLPEPSTDATLTALTLSGIDIGTFSSRTTSYTASAGNDVSETTVTPTVTDSNANYVIKIGGAADADGRVALAVGENVITIEVTADDGETTETYTVTVTRAADPCGDPITADTTIDGSWDDTCLSEKDAPGSSGDRYARFYTFTLSDASDVTITLNSDEDTYLYLLDGHGQGGATLHENDDIEAGGVNLNSRISVSLQAGDYTIEATTYNALVEGDFTLTVEGLDEEPEPDPEPEAEPCEKVVSTDGSIDGSWDDTCLSEKDAVGGTGDRYARFFTFTLAQAEDVTITLTSEEDTYLYMLDGHGKDGTTLHENDDIESNVNLNSRISVNLQAGDYTIEATTYHAEMSGAFTLEIEGLGGGTTTLPDLEVGTPSVDDANPSSGATFTLSATVTNAGDGESAATTLRYYRSTNATISGADTEVGTDDVGALAAAATSDQSIDLTAPSTAGTYYYGACVDAVTDESDTTDNCSSAVTVPVLQSDEVEQGDPDLEVGAPSVDDASPETGATFTLSTTVTNAGDGESEATTLRYYQSTDDTITSEDTEVGTDSVGTLAADGTSDQSIDLTAPSTAGTYYYGACVDAVTDETDTADNCSSAVTVDVVVPATGPDLEVGAPSVDEASPETGETITLSVTVTNSGDEESLSTMLRYYQSTDATITTSDTELVTATLGPLDAAGTSDESVSFTAPSTAGTHYYGACVDAVTDESDTTDNCSVSLTVDVQASTTPPTDPQYPDLEVGTPSVDDASPATGATFTLSATVTNAGDGESAATTLRYYQSADDTITTSDTEVGTDSVETLAAAGTSDQSISLTAPSTAGTYYYGACVDKVTDESDATDNCSSSVKVDVEDTTPPPTARPDLEVSTPSFSNASPTTGATFTLSATVTNAGDGDSTASVLRYYRSANSTISTTDTQLGTDEVGALASSGSSGQSISLTAPSRAGTYYYGACVDSVTNESDTTDNCSPAAALTVRAIPDLDVDDISAGDTTLVTDEPFTLSAKVVNEGGGASAATTLRYYRTPNTASPLSGTEVGTDPVGALAAGGSSSESIALTAPSTAGTYYYGACVERRSGVSNPSYSCSSSLRVTVSERTNETGPDVTIHYIHIHVGLDTYTSVSTLDIGPGETFGLHPQPRNAGDLASAGTTVRFYRSTDTTITTSDTQVGTDSMGVLRAGQYASFTDLDLTAPSALGTYYYGACADTVTDESDTTNNCSSAVTINVIDLQGNPDLQVGTPSVSDSSPDTGETFTLSATVTNEGDGESATTTLRYYRSADSRIHTSDTEVGTDLIGALAASGTSSQSIDLTAPSTAGTYYYGACVDSVTHESNAINNCSSAVTVTVQQPQTPTQGSPDLQVGTPTVDNASPEVESEFELSVTVTNAGDGESTATTLNYYRSTNATITTADTWVNSDSVSALAAGGTSEESNPLYAPLTSGTYYYGACVEAVSGESDTTNNCSPSVTVTVPVPPVSPELEITAVWAEDSTPERGTKFRLVATVTNKGDGESHATTIRFYRSTDATITTEDVQETVNTVARIPAGGSDERGARIFARFSTGATYYYGACVDAVARESDTTNNCSSAVEVTTVDLETHVDLEVETPSVGDSTPATEAPFRLSAKVVNTGDRYLREETTLRYYRSTDTTITTSDTEVGTDKVTIFYDDDTNDHFTYVTAPATPGTYYYGACVDSPTDGTEADATNNCSSSVKVTVSQRTAQNGPDLVMFDVKVDPADVPPGRSFKLRRSVRNDGDEVTHGPRIRYYRSDDSTITAEDTSIFNSSIYGWMYIGRTSVNAIPSAAPSENGTYYYGVCVVAVKWETDTTNNCSSGVALNVYQTDLTVSASADPAELNPGASFKLTGKITNGGDSDVVSSPMTLRYYRSTDSTITTSDTEIKSVDAGAAVSQGSTLEKPYRFGAPSTIGTYYYGVCVDALLVETDSGNNCSAAVSVRTRLRPDLDVLGGSGYQIPLVPGGSFYLTTRLENEGEGPSAATTLRYYRSDDTTITTSDTEVGTKEVEALAAGAIVHKRIDLTAPSTPGTYYYGSCVDAVPDESDTTNNCTRATTLVVPVPAPDLTVLGSLSKVHSILAPGTAVTLTALVLNAGAEDAEASSLRYYRSDEDQTISSADTLLDTDEIAALDSGDSSEYSIDITAPLAPGSYHFGACVDTVTDELVTDNNCSFGRWMGVTTPDLVVGTPTVDDASPDTGEKFTLSATVTNTGGRDAAATTLRYYRSTDATITSDDTEVGTDDVSALENREDSDQSIELTAPTTAGTYYYGACVDTVTYEYDTEDNCSASVKVVATAPNLQVGTPSVDDASPDAGATFTLSATVTNAGDRAAVATTLRYYQSTDATITSADTELGTDDISALAAAGTSDQSIDLTAPSETGTYYYGACVDAVTDESSTTDNCSASVTITIE